MRVLVAGGGNVGRYLGRILVRSDHEVTIIDHDESRVAQAREESGATVMLGDATEPSLLERSGIRAADVVVAATGHDEDNLVVASLAKFEFEVPQVVARVKNALNAWLYEPDMGVDVLVSAPHTIAQLIEEQVTVGDVVQLLELARGQAGGSADAGEAVRRVLEDMRDDVELLQAEIVVGELPLVSLPQGFLETVLRNLLANALEAGASTVELFARPDGTICVSDDGPGVPPERAARIFGVYSGKFGGAGLGLTLCREILRRRGGDIWLELPSTFAFHIA